MIAFAVYTNGKKEKRADLAGAYLVGTDDVALRAEITFKDGVIECQKRPAGPAGLVLQWRVADVGKVLVETARLPERDKPHVRQVDHSRRQPRPIRHELREGGWGD